MFKVFTAVVKILKESYFRCASSFDIRVYKIYVSRRVNKRGGKSGCEVIGIEARRVVVVGGGVWDVRVWVWVGRGVRVDMGRVRKRGFFGVEYFCNGLG